MVTGLSALAKCEVDKMDSIYMDNGKGFGATLGIRAWIGRVMAKLEEEACFPERGCLKV
jgi:hypothetical protein